MWMWLAGIALAANVFTFVTTAAYKDITHRAEIAAVRIDEQTACEGRISEGTTYLKEQIDKAFKPKKKRIVKERPWWDWGLLG